MAFGSIILGAFILVFFGMLAGCTLSERLLQAQARRQAEFQRSLNRQLNRASGCKAKLLAPIP